MQLTLSPAGRSLVVTGALLFLAGVLQGAVIDMHANPRMALSAHLDAVQSGMAVMIAGILWSVTRLGDLAERVARWTLAIGMVGLWVGLTVAAVSGASEVLPMAGAGHSGSALAETVVAVLVLGSSGLLSIGWALLVWGLLRASMPR